MQKAYTPGEFENDIYKRWEASGLFAPKISRKKPFTIMMPPPNATGTLHLGHAVMLALQDIMTRFHRMKGDPTLWLPGTDHAAIATQNKVEKLLAEEGKTRHDLGREAFVKRVNQFILESQDIIRNQVRKMGSSCDWSRERYTFEPELNASVRTMFVRMYEAGLIYQGKRIVNWCVRCSSTLADDEVVYTEERSKFYYLKYGPFVIGTARPETKFLDKVIVVHPDDERYKKYHGKKLKVAWIEGDVEAHILPDSAVDPNFGSGAMTITPAHDFADFEIAQKHKLHIVEIIDEKGNLNKHAGEFAGRNAREARDDIIEKLQSKSLVEKIEDNYLHNISLCYRCKSPIEPLVSKQWFITVDKKFGKPAKSLKQRSLEVVKKGKIKILPKQFEKTYFHWMENLHDWCISRQIWFGHQIPAWYCLGCKRKDPIVQENPPNSCPDCGSDKLQQDPDNLDTWFSSGMWSFSTLGWPKKTSDLEYFHPTSVLETGYDILFFWVARMILMTSFALNDIPFETVYLHGLVRTREGKKMSKSDAATCIDPLDMIEKYGADALRLSMVIGATPGNDIRLYEEKIAGFRNFVNKIWNAARFAYLQMGEARSATAAPKAETLADKWILHRTQELIAEVSADIDAFRFSEAGMKIYDFTWGEFCAWYLEIAKESKNQGVVVYVLKTLLTLLHPFVPFVTEAIWSKLGETTLLMSRSWPTDQEKFHFPKEADQMQCIIDAVTMIRSLRHDHGIPAAAKIHAVIVDEKRGEIFREKQAVIARLARLERLDIEHNDPRIRPAYTGITSCGTTVVLPVADVKDVTEQLKKLQREIHSLTEYIKSLHQKLQNTKFIENAPATVVDEVRTKHAEAEGKLQQLRKKMSELQ